MFAGGENMRDFWFSDDPDNDPRSRRLFARVQALVDKCGFWNAELCITRHRGVNADVQVHIHERNSSASDRRTRRQLGSSAAQSLCREVFDELLATSALRFGRYEFIIGAGRVRIMRVTMSARWSEAV
jgi:hypothetical protein